MILYPPNKRLYDINGDTTCCSIMFNTSTCRDDDRLKRLVGVGTYHSRIIIEICLMYSKKNKRGEQKMEEKETAVEQPNEIDYIQVIKEMKETMVPIDRHNAVIDENKKLIKALQNGERIDTGENKTNSSEEIDKLRKELYGGSNSLSNLDYVTKQLRLRELLLDAGERDIALPIGDVELSSEDITKMENTIDVLQQCVDAADGDAALFNMELMRRLKDNVYMRR